eukprot:5485663-Prymnesium_polylepis.1
MMSHSRIEDASGGQGGAIDVQGGSTTIITSTIVGSTATNAGGAIWMQTGDLTLSDGTSILNSSASRGGAVIEFQGGQVTLSHSLVMRFDGAECFRFQSGELHLEFTTIQATSSHPILFVPLDATNPLLLATLTTFRVRSCDSAVFHQEGTAQ